jgi:hypothetical protein
MKNIVLDEKMVSDNPALLFPAESKKKEIALFLPSTLRADIQRFERSDSAKELLRLIDTSAAQGNLTIRDPIWASTYRLAKHLLKKGQKKADDQETPSTATSLLDPDLDLPPEVHAVENAGWLEFHKTELRAVIGLAIQLKLSDPDTFVATEDWLIKQECESRNIQTMNSATLRQELGIETLSEEVKSQTKIYFKLRRKLRQIFSLKLAALVVIASPVSFLFWHINEIVKNTYVAAALIILLVLLGFLFYWCRGWYRWQYGLVEFIFGVVGISKVFFPNLDTMFHQPIKQDIVQLVASVYVIVRGLDNFGKGLERTPLAFRISWKNFFGNQ